MLSRIESVEAAPPERPLVLDVGRPWPRPKVVWVHSKGQEPYLFRPGRDPCSPHEWPYNLQALRGTEDYEDILTWYCNRHPAVSRADLDRLVEELSFCVEGRQISVEIHHDMDTGERFPWFLVWGFAQDPSDDEDRMKGSFRTRCLASPYLRAAYDLVMVSFMAGSFEDRHALEGS